MMLLEGVAQAIHCNNSVRVAYLLEDCLDPGLLHQNITLILFFLVASRPL